MQNRCPNCGGELIYDTTLKKIRCVHCESVFEKEEIQEQTNAHEQQDSFDMNVTVYTCPTCGAQITSLENAAIDYCLYCGSFVTLNQAMKKVKKPDYIIPFSKNKEQCKEAYKSIVARNLYAPKEFKDEKFLEGFKGIYIPFWSYEYTYGPNIHIQGETKYRKGDYIHKEQYNIQAVVHNAKKEVSFDASSSFDDRMARAISPFDYTKRKEYDASYMFGYFADTADVQASTYTKQANELVKDGIWQDLSNDRKIKEGFPKRPSDAQFDANLKLSEQSKLTMIPIWFLTWRKGNRIAYSIVNGDTGKIYSEIPISIGKYLLFSLILALPIFFGLNALITFNATKMLLISLLMSFVMMILYAAQLNTIVRRYLHADDKGYLSIYEKRKNNEIKENVIISTWNSFFSNSSIWIVGIVLMIGIFVGMLSNLLVVAILLAVVVFPVYSLFVMIKQAKVIQDKSAVIDILGVYIAFVVSAIVLIMDPPADIMYYGVAILCMIGIALSAIRIMVRHNDLITRPIPRFFDRKAGKE